MKILLSLLSIIGFSTKIYAGTVKGSITSFGKGVEFATVFITGATKGTVTNLNGYYEIKDVDPGTYVLKTYCPNPHLLRRQPLSLQYQRTQKMSAVCVVV